MDVRSQQNEASQALKLRTWMRKQPELTGCGSWVSFALTTRLYCCVIGDTSDLR